ncbi:Uncharacterized protein OBRU01_10708 [Operophtera brumata]|uniref:Uncharacterized protein n=1 Tax=Operophtera brumata TaxID=104452 RepID=A0A0L7KY16_OPEBR|nr:Uncharacterized protein OBRU01_10708 [Operophtera brumata]
MDDTSSVASHKTEDLVNKGVSNIMESLNNDDRPTRKEPLKSFSRIKINGNNKPLLQITFNCSGENSLQVLDNRVNVTLCDNTGASNQKLNVSMEDNLMEDIQINACDNSETESRDAIDGCDLDRDTVVFKRSISLVEERIQRIPKDKRAQTPIPKAKEKVRPKSEMFPPIRRETRVLSNSSPSLVMNDTEVEVNIENVMSYQDSSSDECINVKCQELGDDFEQLERKIEEDIASKMGSGCGYMEKISEENLSALIENE